MLQKQPEMLEQLVKENQQENEQTDVVNVESEASESEVQLKTRESETDSEARQQQTTEIGEHQGQESNREKPMQDPPTHEDTPHDDRTAKQKTSEDESVIRNAGKLVSSEKHAAQATVLHSKIDIVVSEPSTSVPTKPAVVEKQRFASGTETAVSSSQTNRAVCRAEQSRVFP